jgi:hypothetical protein
MVYMTNERSLVMPTEVQVTFQDNQTRDYKLPVQIWFDGKNYALPVYDERKVKEVVIDPSHILPDVQRANNVWRLDGNGQ